MRKHHEVIAAQEIGALVIGCLVLLRPVAGAILKATKHALGCRPKGSDHAAD